MARPDHMNTVAQRKVGGMEGWQLFRWERVGDGNDFIVEGGVPRPLKSGPHKGKPTWNGVPCQKAAVTQDEIMAEHARYEAETGFCGDCGGSGEVFASWDYKEGVKTKPCKRCQSSGKAPNPAIKE